MLEHVSKIPLKFRSLDDFLKEYAPSVYGIIIKLGSI